MSKFRKSSNSTYGDWITAIVQIGTKTEQVRYIPVLDDGTEDTANAVVIPKKNAPANIFSGKHVIQLSQDKKGIANFRPYNGQVPAKFSRFAGKEDEAPTPKQKQGKFGPYLVFTPLFDVIGGPYKGITVSYQLIYPFQEGDDGLTEFSSYGDRAQQTEEFLDATIGVFDPPKFTDNLLPLFYKMAKKADKSVGLIFNKGFVDSIVELNAGWQQMPDTE